MAKDYSKYKNEDYIIQGNYVFDKKAIRKQQAEAKAFKEKKLKELEEERKKHESGKTVNGVVYVSAYTRSKPGRR